MQEGKKETFAEIGNNKKQNRLYAAVGLFTVFIMLTNGYFPLPKSGYVDVWSMCNWGLTYETGFIVRGLVGTISTFFAGELSYKFIFIMSAVLFLILMTQFVIINIGLFKKSKNITAFILILFLMAQPSNARWLISGAMFARLDNFIIIIALICFYSIYKFDSAKMYVIVLPLTVLAILIHEIFAVAFASLLLALMLVKINKESEKFSIKPLLIYYLPVIVFFLAVILLGGTYLSREKFTSIMQQNLEPGLRDGMVSVARDIVVDDMAAKLERVRYLFTDDTRNLMILTYIAMSPSLILFAGLYKKLYKSAALKAEKISLILVVGACFAPLTSSILGCDHFRWIGYFIFCLSAGIAFLYVYNEKYRQVISDFIKRHMIYFIMAAVIALIFGTFRNMQTMPYIETFYYYRIKVLPEFFS